MISVRRETGTADATSIVNNMRPIVEGVLLPADDVRGTAASMLMDDTKWRELCQRIMAEKDPETLWTLVEELNKALEDREQELRDREPGTA
jgi:hypothetical protein